MKKVKKAKKPMFGNHGFIQTFQGDSEKVRELSITGVMHAVHVRSSYAKDTLPFMKKLALKTLDEVKEK